MKKRMTVKMSESQLGHKEGGGEVYDYLGDVSETREANSVAGVDDFLPAKFFQEEANQSSISQCL